MLKPVSAGLKILERIGASLKRRTLFPVNLMRLILVPDCSKKRILGIWDYKALPWSVGDPLVFIEKLSILKNERGAEAVDICIIYDRDNPAGNRREPHLTTRNAQEYMLEYLSLFSTCPYLGSIFQFNSRKEFYRFLKGNLERYNVFPPIIRHLKEEYNFVGGAPHYNEINEYYRNNGCIPHLQIGDRALQWAVRFYSNKIVKGRYPVALSLRNTPGDEQRNAKSAAWLGFIDKCKNSFPEIVFIVIGRQDEVFEGLRERPNVIIAKDSGTNIISDMALIRASIMYMGTASGINMTAIFSDLPYLLFQWQKSDLIHLFTDLPKDRFLFANEKQKIFYSDQDISPEYLFNQFKSLYTKIADKKMADKT